MNWRELQRRLNTLTEEELWNLIEAELKWRWLRSLSRPYADEKIEAESLANMLVAQSGIPETLDAGLTTSGLSHPNIPETNVGIS